MSTKEPNPERPFYFLFAGYAISCIGDRLWTFAIVFVLESLGGVRLVCINQLIENISAATLCSYVGGWLDRNDRRFGTLTMLLVNNLSIVGSATLLYICFLKPTSWVYVLCIIMSIFCCSLSKIASEGEKLAFTKDWVVVLARRENMETLSKRNAIMTVIDQTSSVIAPLITSLALAIFGYKGSCVFFVAVNLIFWIVERTLLSKVYADVVELHHRQHAAVDEFTEREPRKTESNGICDILHVYTHQSVFSAAIGLTFLYMTVLGPDGITISYGKMQGLPDDVIAWCRSIGSALGILAAATYAGFERRYGVRRTGFIGIITEPIFLLFCVLSVGLPGSPFDPVSFVRDFSLGNWAAQFVAAFTVRSPDDPINIPISNSTAAPQLDWATLRIGDRSALSVLTFFAGLTLARWGLWMADLSITQIMQQNVEEEERGRVFGVQTALCQLFSVIKDVIVIVFPDPRTFGFLIIISVGFVFAGFLLYCYYLLKTRKSLRAVSPALPLDSVVDSQPNLTLNS